MKELKRPTLYRAMKYWGKKPHNIWANIICKNTNVGDIVYDPFAGSAMTFFEAVRMGRKPIVVDVNPLTLFLVTVYSQQYDYTMIKERYFEIEKIIRKSNIYAENYTIKCRNCGCLTDIYNYRWEKEKPNYIAYKCSKCGCIFVQDNEKVGCHYKDTKAWKPQLDISDFTSVCNATIKYFGGSNITDIWTDRNLDLLLDIYQLIVSSDRSIRDALMFAFLQILHLTTKMCASRSSASNRPLSTSWGRPAFMYINKHMEQNPLIQFRRAIFEKNGIINALKSRDEYLPKYSFSQNIEDLVKVDGIVIMRDARDVHLKNVDFVITDPPYGSVIQYGELSSVWNTWLEHYDRKYCYDLSKEIIINKRISRMQYTISLSKVLNNCGDALKQGKKMVMTFNSNDQDDWDSLKMAIDKAGLKIVKMYKQENMRSSEADVLQSTQLSINDYYLTLDKVRRE